jgi:alanyl-tRNA synthetase
MALFGEKYGDRVRMVTVGCADEGLAARGLRLEETSPAPSLKPQAPSAMCSRELCGGTHIGRTGEIGYFRIVGESSVAGGVRRIEALTGSGAEAWADSQAATIHEVAARLGVPASQLLERVEGLLGELKQRQYDLEKLRSQSARGALEGLLGQVRRQNGVAYLAARVDAPDVARLREMGDWLRDKIGSGVVVLGTLIGEKPQILSVVTPDLVKQGYHAGDLVKALAQIVGGGGGGRPDMAQAGGRDSARLDEALAQVERLVSEQGRKM